MKKKGKEEEKRKKEERERCRKVCRRGSQTKNNNGTVGRAAGTRPDTTHQKHTRLGARAHRTIGLVVINTHLFLNKPGLRNNSWTYLKTHKTPPFRFGCSSLQPAGQSQACQESGKELQPRAWSLVGADAGAEPLCAVLLK